ncbi:MAG: LysR family transcriptional regulator [Dehalococcoidia bacterium]
MTDLAPRQKLWVERDGRVVMSDYRLRLLELVRETGSLAQAAATMKLSYRRAWGTVKEIEENLGYALVESAVGGAGGGKTELTPAGCELVEAYRRFKERMDEALERVYTEEMLRGPGPR